MANFDFAEEHKFILAEERTFLRKVVAWLPHRYLLSHHDITGESDAAANC
jgi:hypothetical protein